MNAELLKRLFRAVSEGSEASIESICGAIVQDTRKKHHTQLAKELEEILSTKKTNVRPLRESSERHLTSLPNRKGIEPLVSIISKESLEHHMVLPPEIEEKFVRIEREYAARDRLAQYGLKPRKKILLYGPPGCGKTLGAKRLAWSTGLKLVKVRFDAMISSLFGESASNLRSIFDYCAQSPCLLLLDECDFIARSRSGSKDIGEVQRIVNTLLQLLEDYSFPGLVVATTNVDKELDSALFRRFDDAFAVPLPTENEINKLLQQSLATINTQKNIHWDVLTKELQGLSAADVVKISENAAKLAVLNTENSVSERHIQSAIADFTRHSG